MTVGVIILLITYILLKPGVSQAAFDAKIKNITKDHSGGGEKFTAQVFTQAFRDTWLYGSLKMETMWAAELKE